MTDLGDTIAPKSDQLNADDLITGPRAITITKVSKAKEPEQPISIHFEGDNGKPYKPGKSMRRVLVKVWGRNGDNYVGRQLMLYRDETVRFGGVDVGGIRISHMSHINEKITMALTSSKAQRKPFSVLPMPRTDRPAAGAGAGQAKTSGPVDMDPGADMAVSGDPESPAAKWGAAWFAKLPSYTDKAKLGVDWNAAMKEPAWRELRDQDEAYAARLKASVISAAAKLGEAADGGN